MPSVAGDTRIADVEVGRPVEGVYAVVRKQRRHDKNGDAYLVLELSDSTGSIEGRLWRNADWFDRNIGEGDRVRAIGRGSAFREKLQLDIRRMDKVDADDEAVVDQSFVPEGRRDVADLAGEIDFLVDEIQHPQLAALTRAVWQGPLREQLLNAPATAHDHHAHLGGLVEHTISVAAICMTAAERHERLDRDLLLAAALVHDVGRAKELRAEVAIEADRDGSLVGHVLLTHEWLVEAAAQVRIDTAAAEWWAPFIHAVSNHHGPVERCRTREAVTLASANALDSRLAQRDR